MANLELRIWFRLKYNNVDAGQEQQGLLLVWLAFVELNTHTVDVNRLYEDNSIHSPSRVSDVHVCACERERQGV